MKNTKLPKTGMYLLELLTRPTEREHIVGSFLYEYESKLRNHGGLRARIWFWTQILLSVYPFLKVKAEWSFILLGSYFKLAWRNLRKNELASLINIFGLSVAVGCSIVFFLLLDLEIVSDRFHEHSDKIFMGVYTLEGDETKTQWGNTPFPLGPALEDELPQVVNSVRFDDRSAVVIKGDAVFNETVRFADEEFFEMFTFPLKYGNPAAFTNRNSVVLSENMSVKYFGDENPVGQEIELLINGIREIYTVIGSAEKFPTEASFSFGILIAMDNIEKYYPGVRTDWSRFAEAVFIQVRKKEDITVVQAAMDRYIERHNTVRIDRTIDSFEFMHLPMLSWNSQEIRWSVSSGSTPQALIIFFIIGLLLLLQACLNYVNISLATGAARLKEISLRKVVGGQRSQLILQFIGENLLLCLIAMLLGLVLTEFVILPGFLELTGVNEEVSIFDFFLHSHFWLYLLFILFITGIGAALYPAMVISKFRPVVILRDRVRLGGKKRLTGFLLSIQFAVTFAILSTVVVFWQNNRYQMERDWGYEKDHVLNVRLHSDAQFNIVGQELGGHPAVIRTAGTLHIVGRSSVQAVIEIEGEKHEVNRLDIGNGYAESIGLKLLEGRFFDDAFPADQTGSLVVNRKFLESMQWTEGTGRTVRFDGNLYTIVGVAEDFHFENFFEDIKPLIMRLASPGSYNYLTVNIRAGSGLETNEAFRMIWHNLYPDVPYASFYQDAVFESMYRNNEVVTSIFAATAVVALIISCMGLFGMVSLIISRRMKVYSIHKVLGASDRKISVMISRRFAILITVSISLSLPGTWMFLYGLLDGIYKYHIEIGWFPFIAAASVVVMTATITVYSKIHRAARSNPVSSLRYE